MASLAVFPDPPPSGTITLCEKNADLLTSPVGSQMADQLSYYPDVNLSGELRKAFSRTNETARSAFLEHEDSPKTQLLEAWHEHGLSGVLEVLTSSSQVPKNICVRLIMNAVRQSLWLVRMVSNLQSSMFPHLAMSNDRLVSKFSANAQWYNGFVRCFAWHPHAPKFAVALHDDSISVHQAQPCEIIPILKHKMQKGVADLAWKPMSSSVLAVACHSCVLVWNVDPQSLATRPSTSCVQILSCPGHSPIISLAWCPLDGLLVSASPADNALMVWSVATDTCLPVRRVGNGGVTLLRWSPDGSKLFTGCPSAMFRVWRCEDWTSERWTKLIGRIQTACWSADGCALLFATSEEPLVYGIIFSDNVSSAPKNVASISMAQTAVPLIDMSLIERQMDDSSFVSVGGLIQSIVWDSNGERLAVLCQGASSVFVALFQTRLHPTFELLPTTSLPVPSSDFYSLIRFHSLKQLQERWSSDNLNKLHAVEPNGFIRGMQDETATIVSFKPQFNEGSLLTVVWSSGRISHIPLYYTPRRLVGHCTQDTSLQRHLPISTLLSAHDTF